MIRQNLFHAFALIVAAACIIGTPAQADDLAVSPSPHIVIPSEGRADYDCGDISLLDTRFLRRTVVLTNTGSHAVDILQLVPECKCTSVAADSAGRSALPIQVRPKGKASLTVSIDVSHFEPGRIRKTLLIKIDTGDVVIAFLARLQGPAYFLTDDADFGKIQAGDHRFVDVDLRIDPRAAAIPLAVNSTDANVLVSEMPTGNVACRRYRLTLSANVQPGFLDGQLIVGPATSRLPKGFRFPSIAIPISGTVVSQKAER